MGLPLCGTSLVSAAHTISGNTLHKEGIKVWGRVRVGTYDHVHSTVRLSLAACLFTTSHSSLRRRAHADTAACDILWKLRISQKRDPALPRGDPGLLILVIRIVLLRTVEGGSPRQRGLPPITDSHDQDTSILDPFLTTFCGT